MRQHLVWAVAVTLGAALTVTELTQAEEAGVSGAASAKSEDSKVNVSADTNANAARAETQKNTNADSTQSTVAATPQGSVQADAQVNAGTKDVDSKAQPSADAKANQQTAAETDTKAADSRRDRSVVQGETNRRNVEVEGRTNVNARTERRQQYDGGIRFGARNDRGLAVDNIERNSRYYSSGFRSGDVIVSLDGRPIRTESDFHRYIVSNRRARVPVVVFRDGRRETIYIEHNDQVVSEEPARGHRTRGGAYLGVNFDPQARDAVVVKTVTPGSPAAEVGVQPGDLILALNGQEVRSYPDAISVIRSMQPGDELAIVLERARAEKEVVVVLEAKPGLHTASGDTHLHADRGVERPTDVKVNVNERDDNRLGDRDVDNDGDRDRGLLRRVRD